MAGITVASRSGLRTLDALRFRGWRDVAPASCGGPLFDPCRILLPGP
ncbi:hypothetical protein [Streptomyces sp. NPDC047071]